MTGRRNPNRTRAIFGTVLLLVIGFASIGVGLSDLAHARQISKNGIRVFSVVLENNGVGRNAVLVGYTTITGQHEEGVLDTPDEGLDYVIGSEITVVYDPSSPSVVTLPGAGDGDSWFTIGAGAACLVLLAAVYLWIAVRSRQRSSPRSVLGE
ncbi:MAG: DUF3592 domain-containing protein [Streptosporangiaceae bacterium]|jgi:hypothetical protein